MKQSNLLFESIKKTIARLRQKRTPIYLHEKDITEQFIKSSGPGGQNVNKRDTCVRLAHIPTGLSVKSSLTRHQEINRREARKVLLNDLDELINPDCSESKLRSMMQREKARKKAAKAKKKYACLTGAKKENDDR
jgi:protein subunit release factor B